MKAKAENNSESESESQSQAGSSHQSDTTPKKPLFGDLASKPGLFGNLKASSNGSNGKQSEPMKLFTNTGSSNLFSGSSLFSSTGTGTGSGTTKPTSLFSNNNTTSSLFGSKPLFNFSTVQPSNSFLNKEEGDDSGDEDGDDLFQTEEASAPPQKMDSVSKEKGNKKKKYSKEIENIFVYAKEGDKGKFTSKGKGYLSLEYSDEDGKKVGAVVFRYINYIYL